MEDLSPTHKAIRREKKTDSINGGNAERKGEKGFGTKERKIIYLIDKKRTMMMKKKMMILVVVVVVSEREKGKRLRRTMR